jgi:hypothetical protein
MCPAETRAYELLRDADGELAKWWTPEDLVSSPTTPPSPVEITLKRSARLLRKQEERAQQSSRQDSSPSVTPPPASVPRKRKDRSPETPPQTLKDSPESTPSKKSQPSGSSSSPSSASDVEKLETDETSSEPANGSEKIPRLDAVAATAEYTRILSSTQSPMLLQIPTLLQLHDSVEKSPNHSHHHHLPANSARHSDKEEALFGLVTKYILPAIALAPKLQLSYILRAKVYAELRLFDLARADALKASELAPGNRRGLVTERLVSWKEKRAFASCAIKVTGNCCDCCVASVSGPPSELDASHKEALTPPTWDAAQESLEAELECTLCLNVLEYPVTSPCGHTWCHSCICRSVDHSRQCPLCRTKLPGSGFFHSRSVNTAIQALISLVYPPSVPTLLSTPPLDPSQSAPQIPIFVCSLVFPGAKQGFHVFEPRYRVSSFLYCIPFVSYSF